MRKVLVGAVHVSSIVGAVSLSHVLVVMRAIETGFSENGVKGYAA